MAHRITRLLLASTALTLAAHAAPAVAQSSRAQTLEQRLQQLEQSVSQLRAELDAERSKNAQLQQQQVSQEQVRTVARDEAKVAIADAAKAAPKPADGFKVGGTTVKLGGFVKTVAMVNKFSDGPVAGNSLGRDFYVPATIPVAAPGAEKSYSYTDFSAKQTRLTLSTSTPVDKHTLGGYLEMDFQTSQGTQGSERTTNGYNPALRRAYVTFDNLLAGQDWSTFMNPGVLPETADFLGVSEGTVFVRQPQVRYTMALSPKTSLAVAIENPETSSVSNKIAGLTENDTDKLPDFAARLGHKDAWGELALAGLVRQLSVNASGQGETRMGWGLSGSGKLLFGDARQHNLSFMATYGSGIGRYVGLNFAPDTIAYFDPNGALSLQPVETFAAFANARIGLTPTVRANIMGSFQDPRYPDAYRLVGANEKAWSAAANLFWSPAKGFDIGGEYRHAVRTIWTFDGDRTGALDQFQMAFKYSF